MSQAKSNKMGVVQLTILTMVNMMGSGIIMLPTKLAEVGTISIISWLVTAVGSMALAWAFAKCGMFSRGFNLKKEWLTLEEVVGSALQMLEPGLSSPINLSLPEPLTLIHVDGPLFERVLINLLENAVKYAGAQAEIGIDAHVEGENLQLDVWDNGPGLPPGQEQTIFDKFARGNKESAVPGVGLGLAICRAIVDVHGGTITAFNRPEGGACFRVTLPQQTAPELEEFHEDM